MSFDLFAVHLANVAALVLGRRLQWQQTAKLSLDFSAIVASLTQEDQNMSVVFSGGSLTDSGTTYRVGRVDSCVYSQAACGDEAAGCKLIDRSIGEFLCLACVGADLCGTDRAGAQWSRH